MFVKKLLRSTMLALIIGGTGADFAAAAIRVMSYNVDADTDRNRDGSLNTLDGSYNAANVAGVVQAIANYTLSGNQQAPDVISLQELNYVPSATLTAVVNSLNGIYGAGYYKADTTVTGKSTGNSIGNGQNGLIYRASTISVTGAAVIGTPAGDGISRTPIRYKLQANGVGGVNSFYLYTEHTKASSGVDEAARRSFETAAVRADADAIAAGDSTAHIIYTGDFNLAGVGSSSSVRLNTGGSNEQSYKNLIAAGTGAQAYDPLGLSSFINYTSSMTKYYTEADDSLSRRYDLQLVTGNMLPTSLDAGLRLIANTYTAFGANYYTADGVLSTAVEYQGSVATSANALATGIPLSDLQNLLDTTDHLPIVADYAFNVPEPGMMTLIGVAAVIGLRRSRRS